MDGPLNKEIGAWDDEGGAASGPLSPGATSLTGTTSQVEWATLIKRRVNDEFDRVAAAFHSVAARQKNPQRADTEAIIAIVEEKRAEVLLRKEAGYFIHDWQEIRDQVRLMIFHDARYQAIKARKVARR